MKWKQEDVRAVIERLVDAFLDAGHFIEIADIEPEDRDQWATILAPTRDRAAIVALLVADAEKDRAVYVSDSRRQAVGWFHIIFQGVDSYPIGDQTMRSASFAALIAPAHDFAISIYDRMNGITR